VVTYLHTPTRPGTHIRTHTHRKYVILIAFPPPQWFGERASMLLYTDIACFFALTFTDCKEHPKFLGFGLYPSSNILIKLKVIPRTENIRNRPTWLV
jgi:hypothetical protein